MPFEGVVPALTTDGPTQGEPLKEGAGAPRVRPSVPKPRPPVPKPAVKLQ